MSACDGTGTLGCPGCTVCAEHRRPAPAGRHSSLLPPPALRTPQWVAEQKAHEAQLRLIPVDIAWAQVHVPEPEY